VLPPDAIGRNLKDLADFVKARQWFGKVKAHTNKLISSSCPFGELCVPTFSAYCFVDPIKEFKALI
jgi:hypothetical protein